MPEPDDPLLKLNRWIGNARDAGLPSPASVAFITANLDAQPSARTVSLKRIEPDVLIFTTALWTRKARELDENAQVALLFHWPSLGRQVHVMGEAVLGERELAVELGPSAISLISSRPSSLARDNRSPISRRCAHGTVISLTRRGVLQHARRIGGL